MTWGYALGWPPIYLAEDEDPLIAKLKLVKKHGLQSAAVDLSEWSEMESDRRSRIADLLNEWDLVLTLGVRCTWGSPDQDLTREVDGILEDLGRWGAMARAPICTTAGEGHHRFADDPPLAAQLDTLTRGLVPLAKGCKELGMPLAIENHGDYYVSDLIELCHRAPGLGIFFDTGNCCLIGEKPLQAAKEAAPFTLGSHFKDQKVAPKPAASPLCFEVGNAIPGRGSLPMREIYQVILAGCPDRDRLAMQIEMFPSPWNGPPAMEQFAEAAAFVLSLEARP
jgi:sugar phosphate isomerase/epimerase